MNNTNFKDDVSVIKSALKENFTDCTISCKSDLNSKKIVITIKTTLNFPSDLNSADAKEYGLRKMLSTGKTLYDRDHIHLDVYSLLYKEEYLKDFPEFKMLSKKVLNVFKSLRLSLRSIGLDRKEGVFPIDHFSSYFYFEKK